MCIMASPVEEVKNTRIFVGHDGNGRQATLYAMSVELQHKTGKGNAMILPVPMDSEDPMGIAISLVDLTKMPDFFKTLDEWFTPRSKGRSIGEATKGLSRSLEVHQVGKYDVSIAPTVDDVKLLNKDVFDVSKTTEAALRDNYASGFSFVVAQLRESGDFHPLAYTHPIVGNRLFIPTRHEHGEDTVLPHWDHHIYHQEDSILDVAPKIGYHTVSSGNMGLSQPIVRFAYEVGVRVPDLGSFVRNRSITQIKAHGELPNIDLTLKVT